MRLSAQLDVLCERAVCLPSISLHTVYRSVVVAELLYATSAGYRFSTAADRQRLEAVSRRGIRSGLCSVDQSTVSELVDAADESLFTQLVYNKSHLLHQLLPERRNCRYL